MTEDERKRKIQAILDKADEAMAVDESDTQFARSEFNDRQPQLNTVAILHAPHRGKTRVRKHPFEKSLPVNVRLARDDVETSHEHIRRRGARQIRIAEDVRVIERPLAQQSFRIDRQPPAMAVMQDIVVMDVAVQ